MRRRQVVLAVIVLVTLAGVLVAMRSYVHGLTFVVRAANLQSVVRRVADLDARPVTERRIEIDSGSATGPSFSARLYLPDRLPRRMVLLVSGLHPAGIDEPRLMDLARQLAAAGLAVVTPDFPELSRFEITPAITDAIEASALWLVQSSKTPGAVATEGRIGILGVSFSGGLAVVAAGRSALRGHVAYVLSLGGHDDLPRVLRYLCTGSEPLPPGRLGVRLDAAHADRNATFVRPPHDYGVAVILLGVADRAAPASQVDRLREAVRRFLAASTLDRTDKAGAQKEFDELRKLAAALPEPSATLLRYLNERDVIHLGARLLPYIGAYGNSSSLSPSRSAKPSAAVFLLHGTDDNVVPTIESEYLADRLRGETPVRLLLSDLLSHADTARPARLTDAMQLASFWGDVLSR